METIGRFQVWGFGFIGRHYGKKDQLYSLWAVPFLAG